ncbi:hypothetical protein IFE09_01190 [Streptomyces microflavus]|nr:hypothetical protein IFE09_01190 [Streptomyces microflavus]
MVVELVWVEGAAVGGEAVGGVRVVSVDVRAPLRLRGLLVGERRRQFGVLLPLAEQKTADQQTHHGESGDGEEDGRQRARPVGEWGGQ